MKKMKTEKKISKNSLIHIMTAMTRDKDDWAFTGDFILDVNNPINKHGVLIHVDNAVKWRSIKGKYFKQFFNSVDEQVPNRKFKVETLEGHTIYIYIIEGEESFGLNQLLFSINKCHRSLVMEELNKAGIKYENGKSLLMNNTCTKMDDVVYLPDMRSVFEIFDVAVKKLLHIKLSEC